MAGITPRLDARLALLRYAHDIETAVEEQAKIPGYPSEATDHLSAVAYYMRLAAAYVETLPDIQEDQSETST